MSRIVERLAEVVIFWRNGASRPVDRSIVRGYRFAVQSTRRDGDRFRRRLTFRESACSANHNIRHYL